MMKERVLVTGASGIVGQALVAALVDGGYSVNALSRQKRQTDLPNVRFYEWDIAAGEIDATCMDGVGSIVHLAGENIAALPWSNKRKRAILTSRTQPIGLIYDVLRKQHGHTVKTVVSASATGYYNHRGDEWMSEDKAPAADFLGQTCVAWEQAVSKGKELGLRTVSLRSGVILSDKGGIYDRFASMIRKGLGIVPGKGTQWMPWIHIDDAVAMYLFALEHQGIRGVYNMAAPGQVTMSTFVHTIANQQDKPLWLPRVPSFLLKAILGQMSEMLLSSTRVSVEKIQNAGFTFAYPEIKGAINALNPRPQA
ncbi:TIGR01777 family oxidoreductase [Parapedobacter pyrenivorans]|uniref:TIGR01777 family oxidoreductase n=1 Tax=Parapedobacter pyrenivorans TaxID=1305674 RepID=UPI00333E8A66